MGGSSNWCVGVGVVVGLLSVTFERGLVGHRRLIIWAVQGTPFSCCSWGHLGGSTSCCVGVGGFFEVLLVLFEPGRVFHCRLLIGILLGSINGKAGCRLWVSRGWDLCCDVCVLWVGVCLQGRLVG